MKNSHEQMCRDMEGEARLGDEAHEHATVTLSVFGIVVSWSLGAERLTGYRAQEVIGRAYAFLYPDETSANGRSSQRERTMILPNGKYEEEGWRMREDGSLFFASELTRPMFDGTGKLAGCEKVIRNLSDSCTSNKALHHSDKFPLRLLGSARDCAVHMLDPSGCIVGWSIGAELLTGYHAEEVIAKHYQMLFRWEDRTEGFPSWQLQRARLHGCIEESGWLLRKDGSVVWANFVLTPIHSFDGSHVGFSKVARDRREGGAYMADRGCGGTAWATAPARAHGVVHGSPGGSGVTPL